MPRLLPLLALLALPAVSAAQHGTVTYSVTTRVDIELPPEMEHMRDQFPTENTETKEVLFTDAAVLTRHAPKDEEDEAMESGGGRIIFRMGGRDADEQTFLDLDAGTVTETREFLGRTFRIVDEAPRHAWRLTGEQGTFLDYPVQQAIAQKDSTTYQAWFTTALGASAGPDGFGGLPGVILVLTDGRRTYEATAISTVAPDAEALVPPTNGREVTQAEFDEIMAEKLEELEESRPRGGRGGFRIITRN